MINGKAEHSQIAFELNERVAGNRLHPDFSGATIMYAKKNKDKNNNDIYTIYNCGPLTWELSREGKTAQQPPNAEVRINSNLVIKVDPTKCLLKVLGIREKK
jgi:hypothetical protein